MSRRGWWRRNLLPLSILAVLLPAAVLTLGWRDWTLAHSSVFDGTIPVVAEEGDTVQLADTTWGPIRATAVDDVSDLTPPPHTKVIVVTIPVSPDTSDPVRCDYPVLVQQSTGRQWNQMSFDIGFEYDSTDHLDCAFDATGDYEMVVPFAVPDAVDGPFWIDIVPYRAGGSDDGGESGDADAGLTGSGGRFVRFSIDPS